MTQLPSLIFKNCTFCYYLGSQERSNRLEGLIWYIKITKGLKMEWEILASWDVSITVISRCVRWLKRWLWDWLTRWDNKKQSRLYSKERPKRKIRRMWETEAQIFLQTSQPSRSRVRLTQQQWIKVEMGWERLRRWVWWPRILVRWSYLRWVQLEEAVWVAVRWRGWCRLIVRRVVMRVRWVVVVSRRIGDER